MAKSGVGRKGYLEDKTIQQVVRLSISIVLKALRDKTYDKDKKIELARHFGLRGMPQIVEGEGAAQQVVIIRSDAVQSQAVSGQVHLLRSPLSGDGVGVGNREVALPDSPGASAVSEVSE